MKKRIFGIMLSLVFMGNGLHAEDFGICEYDDVLVASSIGNWTERFDGLPPNTAFFAKEDGGVGNLIDGETENKQSDFWFNHGSMATLEKPAFLTMKLPEVREVTQIILNNTNAKADSTTYSLRFSSDPTDHEGIDTITQWQDIIAPNAIGTVSKDQEVVVDLGVPIRARYVQVALSTQEQIVTFNEIVIRGSVGCSKIEKKTMNNGKEVGEPKSNIPFIVLGVIMFVMAGMLVVWRK